MKIRRLGWAGLEISAQGESLVVDHAHDSSPLLQTFWQGGAPVPPTTTNALAALVTHLHEDHTDVGAIEATVDAGGLVLRPAPAVGTDEENVFTVAAEAALEASRLNPRVVQEWEVTEVGPFTVTAVPAIDGLGDPQLSWVVEADGQRVFHGGDALFHGYWWLIAGRLGPIDVAALPINGAVVDLPHLQPQSTQAACMGPSDAVQAAVSLAAKTLVPIHYGVVWPGMYDEDDQPIAHVRQVAEEAGQRVVVLEPGETLDVAAVR